MWKIQVPSRYCYVCRTPGVDAALPEGESLYWLSLHHLGRWCNYARKTPSVSLKQYVPQGALPATVMVELWGRQDWDRCCFVHSLLISILINMPHLRNASPERLLHLLTSSVCMSANISELLLWCLSWNKKPCATQMCILGNQTAKLWPP